MRLMREDEWEPLRLNHSYPPIPSKSAYLCESRGGGKKPLHDREGRRRIAMEPGKAPEIAARLGLSVSYVFTCRREFQSERDAAGLSGHAPAYEAPDRLTIALMDLPQSKTAKQFGISPSTVWAYRKEFHAERIAAGLESTKGTDASRPLEVADGGMPGGEPLARVVAGQGSEIKDWLL